MKFTAVLVACLSAFATAHVLPDSSTPHNVERADGLDFFSGLLSTINKFPGKKEVVHIALCMRHHHTWTFDESQKDKGTVSFSGVDHKCCEMAREGWEQYKEQWGHIATPVFNEQCDGGSLTGMSAKAIEVLKSVLKINKA